jgi:putative transposase
MTRGVDHCAMFRGTVDRTLWIARYAKTLARYDWESFIYCQMTTHLHLLIKTRHPNLARGMQWLNGGYGYGFNQRHGRDGHLLRGRYSSVLIESEEHFAAAWEYIAYNPVRAGLCRRPEDWPWSGVAPGQPLPPTDTPRGLTPVLEARDGAEVALVRARVEDLGDLVGGEAQLVVGGEEVRAEP